jgi:hypothetical protein
VYVDGGTFTMADGEISGNTVSSGNSSGGGGVVVYSNGTFTMNGGEITGNTATATISAYGSGVYVWSGTFTMSDGAAVNENNDVYLSAGKTITVNSVLTGTTPAAVITPASYTIGTTLLLGSDVLTEHTKFAVAPNGGADGYSIDSEGKLFRAGAGSIIKFKGPEDESFNLTEPEDVLVWSDPGSGISLEVTAGIYSYYRWYLDGFLIDGMEGADVTELSMYANQFSIGQHTITVRVTKGTGQDAVIYSKQVTFTVAMFAE